MEVLSGFGRDVTRGARSLLKTPAFAIGAVLTVALTVGATTAIYSVVHGVLLRQLPFRDADRVFWIWSDQPGRDRVPFSVPDFIDYRDSITLLDGYAGYFLYSANLSDDSATERVQGLRVTSNFFDVLGASAQHGRLLRAGDEQPGVDRVVVLTDAFWRRRLGGDPAIVGRSLRLNGEALMVLGVLAPGFATTIPGVELLVPFSPDHDPRREARNSVNFVQGVGRLRAGVSEAQALSELNGIARRLQEKFPVENARKRGVKLVGALEGVAGSFRTALLTLFAAVGAVLLIACANLANLMLTRAASRRKELAVQLALGSSRGALVRQVLVEALLVSFGGGLLGLVIATWGINGLVALAPAALPRAGEIAIDPAVLLFALALATATGMVFGVLPAVTSSRVDIRESLLSGGRGSTGGSGRLRGWLVSAEVSLAVILLVVMTMLGKSFERVQSVTPGFDAEGVLSMRLTLPASRFRDRDAIANFQRALADRFGSLPGVTHGGAITLLPMSGLLARVPFTVEGQPIERERVPYAQYRTVTSGYFEAARIPLIRGRTFSAIDTADTRAVVVISEALAAQWLPGIDPIGARLLVDDNDVGARPIEIIGVVGNVKQLGLDAPPTQDLYLTYAQAHPDNVPAAAANMFWILRVASADPMTLAPAVAKEVRSVDADVAASQVRPLSAYLTDSVGSRRFSVTVMIAFGLAALLLALTGVYAVVMHGAQQQAREIGIRMALGAAVGDIARLVMGHGLKSVITGLVIGVVLAAVVMRAIASLLFELASFDLSTFGQVAAVVGVVSVMACAVPIVRTRKYVSLIASE